MKEAAFTAEKELLAQAVREPGDRGEPPAEFTRTGRTRRGKSAASWQSRLYPAAAGLLFLLLWQLGALHGLLGLEPYQLPLPSDIGASIRDNADVLWLYSLYTGAEIAGGCLLGSVLGLAAAVGASFLPRAGQAGISVLAAVSAVPIVALSPIASSWFGDGILSRIAVVAVLTTATMAVSAYKGLTAIEPSYLELMSSAAADRWQTLRKLRLPHALPDIFSALKIGMSTGIIGAIVGEFFVASRGLGYLLSDQIRLGNMPLAWACITIAAVLGIVLYTLIEGAERFAIPWHVSQRRSS
ncbi:binding-protein-dependent transport systems inner membrane component [Paenibacillus mucilaginosus 3016]|uniref:Binding-protein-dependent transport systems inner membrane component n=1 Tax=Paenibacillus mucilaginosus 3016 TaxID=1116391 RepID=H6NHK8_9BACL|nr:ABC transporter permease [Paenibacillus mucilaginosus]AFC29605.1 binding-protein-dependent transport systems inner membrane component [Paenibacillus mucilaginosus 3016]WFA18287.1 ABC transporter permease [Paenibacillus mucilaginosus]